MKSSKVVWPVARDGRSQLSTKFQLHHRNHPLYQWRQRGKNAIFCKKILLLWPEIAMKSSKVARPVAWEWRQIPTKFQPHQRHHLLYHWRQTGKDAIFHRKNWLLRLEIVRKSYEVASPVAWDELQLPSKFQPHLRNHHRYQWRQSDKEAFFAEHRLLPRPEIAGGFGNGVETLSVSASSLRLPVTPI